MSNQLLFIHGAGEGAYKADKLLTQSLQKELGSGYDIRYPAMPDEDNAPYDLWNEKIEEEIAKMVEPIIVVGHSVGASHLAKILTEIDLTKSIAGIFLLNAPFWGGNGWRYDGYKELVLSKNAASKLPEGVKIFLYHTRDDETVPFSHLDLYAKLLPRATVREIDKGGHQLNNDLSQVAKDIKGLKNEK